MDEDEYNEIYTRREIQRALSGHPDDRPLTMKICGEAGESRWLNVSTEHVRAIRELIATSSPDLGLVGEILAGRA